MLRVMFLCTGNSCRSQMAEAFARELGEGRIESHSAGVAPASEVNPKAVEVMREAGVDIARQRPKEIDQGLIGRMDIVITLCDDAAAACPLTPPSIRRIQWPIKDPVTATGTGGEIMNEFRRVRDEIRERISALIAEEAK